MPLSHSDLNSNIIDNINVNDLDNSQFLKLHVNTIKISTQYVIRKLKQLIKNLKTKPLHHNQIWHCYQKNRHYLYIYNIISALKVMSNWSRKHSVQNQELSPHLLTTFYKFHHLINSVLFLKFYCSINNRNNI